MLMNNKSLINETFITWYLRALFLFLKLIILKKFKVKKNKNKMV